MSNEIFDHKRVAQGYKNRPFLHRQVVEDFQQDMKGHIFENGLDVGCGAGLSTKALKLICRSVTGTDCSEEMIAVAKELSELEPDYKFLTCNAEEIGVIDNKFDIVTAAGVIQWVDRSVFLQELKKILKKDSSLLIYDFWITDKMKDNTSYTAWWNEKYSNEFPRPPRNESVWKDDDLQKDGFYIVTQSQLDMEYEFDLQSFITFMMIQSNVNAKIDSGEKSLEEVRAWFEDSLTKIFVKEKEKLAFAGYRWHIKVK